MANVFEMERVVATGNVQELICQFIDLTMPASEIKEIQKTVIIDNCHVVIDKVIIDGRLRKNIMFKAVAAGFPLPGNVQACTGVTTTFAGPIQALDVEIAFNALIPVPGARPGDRCVVLQAFVEGEKEEAANIQPTGAFTVLIDKSIVFVCVKVVRETITNQVSGTGAAGGVTAVTALNGQQQQQQVQICPPRRSTGFFPGGDGTIPNAQRGLLNGTFIGPTLIFPGVQNPGIPTTIPLPNTVANFTGSQVQIATGQDP